MKIVVFAALVAWAPTATAAPRTAAAKAAFNRGVAAYQKGDYAQASEALGKSFGLETDTETLYAWAQAERKLDHCDQASVLYEKLLTFDLPAENKSAIRTKLGECKALLGENPPPVPAPSESAPSVARVEPPAVSSDAPQAGGRPWWKDPIGDGVVGAGVVGVGIGAVMLISANGANRDKATAPSYAAFQALEDKARSRGSIGVISSALGAGLIVGGIVWYATHRSREAGTQVSGWIGPGGGGFAAVGRF